MIRKPGGSNGKPRHGLIKPELLGIALASFGAIAFGLNIFLFKVAFNAGATPLTLLATRLAIATLAMVLYHRLTRQSFTVPRRTLTLMLLLGTVGFATGPLLFAMAVDISPVSVVAPLFFSYPLWTSILAATLRITPLRKELVAALILGMTGILLLFSLPHGRLSGSLLALTAGFTTALYFLWAQVLIRNTRPAVGATITTGGGAVLFILVGAFQGEWISLSALAPTILVGALTAVGYLATFEAIAKIGAAHSAVVQLLEPVTSILLAAVFLSEELTLRAISGAILVLSTLPLLARLQRRTMTTNASGY